MQFGQSRLHCPSLSLQLPQRPVSRLQPRPAPQPGQLAEQTSSLVLQPPLQVPLSKLQLPPLGQPGQSRLQLLLVSSQLTHLPLLSQVRPLPQPGQSALQVSSRTSHAQRPFEHSCAPGQSELRSQEPHSRQRTLPPQPSSISRPQSFAPHARG